MRRKAGNSKNMRREAGNSKKIGEEKLEIAKNRRR